MTARAIAKALGYKPFGQFRKEVTARIRASVDLTEKQKHFALANGRQTGRSTKILCDLLACVSEGEAVEIGRTNGEAARKNFIMRARELAAQLGLNPRLIKSGLSNRTRYYDHVWP